MQDRDGGPRTVRDGRARKRPQGLGAGVSERRPSLPFVEVLVVNCGMPLCPCEALWRVRFFAAEPGRRMQSFLCAARDGTALSVCSGCRDQLVATPALLGRLLHLYWSRLEAGARACGEEPPAPEHWRVAFFPRDTDAALDIEALTGSRETVAQVLVGPAHPDPRGNPEAN